MARSKKAACKKKNNGRVKLRFLALVMIGVGVMLALASLVARHRMDLPATWTQLPHNAPNISSPETGSALSASAALATGEPVLFVFVPQEKCSRQYCVTADVVEEHLPDHAQEIHVVEVPVYSLFMYTAGAPPDFIIADWDLYPTGPQKEWMPEATLTEFGWGISDTALVLVGGGGSASGCEIEQAVKSKHNKKPSFTIEMPTDIRSGRIPFIHLLLTKASSLSKDRRCSDKHRRQNQRQLLIEEIASLHHW
ncbi:MAG: hypothetical protein R3245_05915 [Kiloniellales bacterium]|nr:hypothetical protein [Kiloniellales bacterium]